MSTGAAAQESRFWVMWRASMNSLALALSSAVVGATLVAVSWRFGESGPFVLVSLALAPFLTLLIATDLRIGALLLLAVLPLNSFVPEFAALPPPLSIPLEALEVTLGFVVVVVALIRLARGQVPLRWTAGLWGALAIIAWALLSLQSTVDIDAGLRSLFSFVGGLTVMMLFVTVVRDTADLRFLAGSFAAIGALVCAYAISTGGPAESSFGGAVISGRLQGLFDQPNQLGAFSALVLFLAVGFALGAQTRARRLAAWAASGALLGGLLLSLSRGAWIGTALGGLYLIWVLPRARRIVASVLIPVLIAATAFGPAISTAPQVQVVSERLSAFTAENPYDSRPAIYAEARRQIITRPLFGYGPGSFPTTSARATTERTTVTADHAHNIWLNWGAELGVPGLLLITLMMVVLGVVGRRTRRAAHAEEDESHEILVAALVASLITVLGQGIVDYPWRNQSIFFGICTVVGLLLAAGRLRTEPAE